MIKSKAVTDLIKRFEDFVKEETLEAEADWSMSEDMKRGKAGLIAGINEVLCELEELLKNQVPIESKAVDYIKYTGDNIDEIWAWFDKHGLQKVDTFFQSVFTDACYIIIYGSSYYRVISESDFNQQFEVTDE